MANRSFTHVRGGHRYSLHRQQGHHQSDNFATQNFNSDWPKLNSESRDTYYHSSGRRDSNFARKRQLCFKTQTNEPSSSSLSSTFPSTRMVRKSNRPKWKRAEDIEVKMFQDAETNRYGHGRGYRRGIGRRFPNGGRYISPGNESTDGFDSHRRHQDPVLSKDDKNFHGKESHYTCPNVEVTTSDFRQSGLQESCQEVTTNAAQANETEDSDSQQQLQFLPCVSGQDLHLLDHMAQYYQVSQEGYFKPICVLECPEIFYEHSIVETPQIPYAFPGICNCDTTYISTNMPPYDSDDQFMVMTRIRRQIEYYLSEENLMKDVFLRSKMDSHGYLDLNLIASFPRVSALTHDINLIIESLKESENVELSCDAGFIRKKANPEIWPLSDQLFSSPTISESSQQYSSKYLLATTASIC